MRTRIKYTNNLLHKNINNKYIVDDFYDEINDIDINNNNNNKVIQDIQDIQDIQVIQDKYIINEAKNINVHNYFLFIILYYIWIFPV